MTPPPPRQSKRYATEWAVLAFGLALTAGLIGHDLSHEHGRVRIVEQDRLATQARVVDENLGQHIDGIHRALESIRANRALPGADRNGSTSERLTILSDAIPGVANLFILDSQGTVVASSEGVLIGRNFAQREYFAVPTASRDGDTLFVSPPFKSILGHHVIVLSRVLSRPDGAFDGVVVAALDAGHFEVVMRSVLYSNDMASTLADSDGKVFVGTTLEPAAADAGPLDAAGPVAGARASAAAPRLHASRAVSPPALHMDKPLTVSVSRSEFVVYAPWRRHATELGGFFALLLPATTVGLSRSQSRRRQIDALEAGADAERALGAERLELALHGACLGLWDWDLASDRFTRNELTRLQLDYASEELGPKGAAWRGLMHPEDTGRVADALQAHFRQESSAYEAEFRIRHKSGRWVWLLSRGKVVERGPGGQPLRMAGTHMDITEKKRTELELQRLNECLTQLSTTDGLTAVGNRRLFDQTLQAEWARAARKRAPVALLMIDVDHFKDYNDRYGHPAGDECLRSLARLISETVKREGELVARYGGEEFALLLPGADLEAACLVAQRCLRAVADAKIGHGLAPVAQPVTMSIGVASATATPGTNPASLVEAADAALYRAKGAGRGRYES